MTTGEKNRRQNRADWKSWTEVQGAAANQTQKQYSVEVLNHTCSQRR